MAHVLWIGGATDSGKTSVARALAEKLGLQVHHYDLYDHVTLPGHWARTDPVRHPHMHSSSVEDHDWMWVDTTPEDLVERWLQTTPERFQLTLEDLLALPCHPPIVAEGYGFTPDLVLPLLTSARQAVWLVSTEDFKRATYERRGQRSLCRDTRSIASAPQSHGSRPVARRAHPETC